MAFKAAFIFIAPETDEEIHKAIIDAPVVQLHVVGVKTYQEAEVVVRKLVEQGIEAIELCAGFGIEGVAKIKAAVKGKALVGVVRFDNHPGFEFRSGDDLF
jgi:2-keto-3-deoxy-6-phosphogluconate aldolase